jgi:hypothetical protein
MTTHTWIRFTRTPAGERIDAKTLQLTDAAADTLAERLPIQGYRLSVRDAGQSQLVVITSRPGASPNTVEYVRAQPVSDAGRQERDGLLGAALIRRFGLMPHIPVHLAAPGVVLWDPLVKATQTAAAWNARNETCAVVCPAGWAVGTHATTTPGEVTCSGCLAVLEQRAAEASAPARPALVLDSDIGSDRDLLALLPSEVAARIEPVMLRDPWCAAALRILATVKDPGWRAAIHPVRIDWGALEAFAVGASQSARIRALAACAFGRATELDLTDLAVRLDEDNFAALLDAFRIAREGLKP